MLGTEHAALATWSVTRIPPEASWGLRSPLSGVFQGRHPLPCGGGEEMGPRQGRALMEFQEVIPRVCAGQARGQGAELPDRRRCRREDTPSGEGPAP